jgi:hypothetical protein
MVVEYGGGTDGSDDAMSAVRSKKNTGTVGTGKNKWTTPPQWKPWVPPKDDRNIRQPESHLLRHTASTDVRNEGNT